MAEEAVNSQVKIIRNVKLAFSGDKATVYQILVTDPDHHNREVSVGTLTFCRVSKTLKLEETPLAEKLRNTFKPRVWNVATGAPNSARNAWSLWQDGKLVGTLYHDRDNRFMTLTEFEGVEFPELAIAKVA